MSERLCQLKNSSGGGGGIDVTEATLSLSSQHGTKTYKGNCTANISAGHVAVVSVWQHAQLSSSGSTLLDVSISITGTENIDYTIIMSDTTSKAVAGEVAAAQEFNGMVIKAINNITITATHKGGQNYPSGGILIYDLS